MDMYFRKFDFRRDLDFLRRSMMENEEYHSFIYRIEVNTFQDFERWITEQMRSSFHDFYSVCSLNDPEIIGYVYSFDYRPDDLHCRICAYFDPIYRGTGASGIAVLHFIDILFSSYPLRKVYFTIFGYNTESLTSNIQAGFTEEAVLKEFKYFKGSFYDLHVLSISRDDFYSKFSFILKEEMAHE